LELLNNALRQTGWPGPEITPQNWRQALATRLKGRDWERITNDVRPFLENPTEVDLLSEENLLRLLDPGVQPNQG
jgi:hypothetical protein